MTNRWSKTDAAFLIGFCVLATLFSLDLFPVGDESFSPRSLKVGRAKRNRGKARKKATRELGSEAIYPWAENNLQPLTVNPDPKNEVPLFWHIPKSGGTTVESIAECLDLRITNRAGALPKFGHDNDTELIAYRPWGARGPTYVNADTTSNSGILRAEHLGLVPSGLADIIFTSYPNLAIAHLYDESHKGRAMGLFRHPVDRLVSKFYYLQIADWERTYHPNWKRLSVKQWAEVNNDNNFMVKKLAGKRMNAQVSDLDLAIAMRTLQERFYVGMMDQMEESIRRFNIVMGIDETKENTKKCMEEYFGHGVEKKNSNSHPKVEEGSEEWEILAEKNSLDVRLYEYVLELFDEQKETIESYSMSAFEEEDTTVEEEKDIVKERE
eukprot:CAMPEP_0181094344 /NCGR_PEP_ID=MMETSP1071-20121207/9944_1 /TAXON_ID=35127 /ORGANISM="Thalassiosira sp., Strain NH16" /LENGTH=381 /DNA_ID=CAMNT_0023176669 /DNA_START=141 /DNA_END=1286 /DNA_ORIENTATION=+